MRRVLLLSLALFLPVGLACGDDGGGGGGTTDEATDEATDEDTISLADWIDQADEICLPNDEVIDALEEPPFDPSDDLTDDQLQQAADYLNDRADLEQDTVDSLRDLPAPDESADEINDILDLVQGAIDDTRAAADAAEDGDQDGLEENLDAAGQQFDEASDMTRDLGFQNCGVEESDNTGTGTGAGA
jgi:hypothetical protein